MKLSEAILLGAAIRPQAFGVLFEDKGSCAVGASMEGAGIATNQQGACGNVWVEWWKLFPVARARVVHPLEGDMGSVHMTIVSLNNIHRWTREAISAWVATVEQSLEAPLAARAAEEGQALVTAQ